MLSRGRGTVLGSGVTQVEDDVTGPKAFQVGVTVVGRE